MINLRPLKLAPWYWALGLMAIATVVFLSLTPEPPASGLNFANADKLLHLLAYFLLAAWFGQLLRGESSLALMAAVLIAIGITLEWLQGLDGVRQRELEDALANACGVVLAWYLCRRGLGGVLARLETRWWGAGDG